MTNYNLEDSDLLNSDVNQGYKIFVPSQTYIILGRSNSNIEDVLVNGTKSPEVKILKRPSGGEAVILSPKMLVIAIKMPLLKGYKPSFYFQKSNTLIIKSLQKLGVQNLHSKGISDISIGEKKILGSAIFKGSDFMFYHAMLNISEEISTISKYLKHPLREPDYRKGRQHSEFVTSLHKMGYNISNTELSELLINSLSNDFFYIFA